MPYKNRTTLTITKETKNKLKEMLKKHNLKYEEAMLGLIQQLEVYGVETT